MCLINGHALRCAVNLGCGSQNHSLEAVTHAACVEHVGSAEHIRLNNVVRVLIRIGNCDERAEVKHPFAAFDRLAHRAWVLQVTAIDLDGRLDLTRQISQAAAVVPAVVAHQRTDGMALLDKLFGQVASNEPPCPGDEDLPGHGNPFRSARTNAPALLRRVAASGRSFGCIATGQAFARPSNPWSPARSYELTPGSATPNQSGFARRVAPHSLTSV